MAAFGSAAPLAPKERYKWKMLAAAAYLRVSTTQQDWKLQRDAVTRAARARGDTIPKRLWFEEKAPVTCLPWSLTRLTLLKVPCAAVTVIGVVGLTFFLMVGVAVILTGAGGAVLVGVPLSVGC